MKIHFHEANQFLAFSGRMGHEVFLGEKNTNQLNIHYIEQIAKKSTDPRMKFNMFSQHESSCSEVPYDQCMYERLSKKMVEQTDDNCTVPWFPQQNGTNSSICTKEKDINTTYYIAWKRILNTMKDCNQPCRSLVVNTGGRNYRQRNETWDHGLIYFYFSSNAFKSIELPLYPLRAFVAEFGGYLGLFLGASLLDFTFRLINLCN